MEKRKIVIPIALFTVFCILLLPIQEVQVYDGTEFGVEIHVEMWHFRDGVLLEYSHHAGVLTTIGADWIEDQLGDSPSTDPAKWIAVSNNSGSPAAGWTEIPEEITTGGMGRAVGTYVSDGVGQWNITKAFSPTASGSCLLTGLYWADTGTTLLCADTFNLVNYQQPDTVQIRWTLTVTGT